MSLNTDSVLETEASEATTSAKLASSSSSSANPITIDLSGSLISFRVLVSRREAGAIIGRNGENISAIRDQYGIKAGVSKVLDGVIDRILTVSGALSQVPDALVAIASAVNKANVDTVKESQLKSLDPTRLISYDYFPLKPLNQRPSYMDIDSYSKTLFLRLLIPNSQIGTLIGLSGSRIQSIQEKYDIKMVVSKGFLENSNERLVDLQGEEAGLRNALNEIGIYLLKDYNGTTSTSFYIPCASLNSPYGANTHSNRSARHNVSTNVRESGKEIIKKISFPGDYLGALIGKKGIRIQEIRRSSGSAIAVDTEDGEDGEREITIIGVASAVEKAIELLNMYYEREQKRRLNAE